MTKIDIENMIQKDKLIAIIRAEKIADIHKVVEALISGGVKILEVSFNTPGAADFIRTIRTDFDGRVLCGAGTVLDEVMAIQAIQAGSQFVISPVYKPEMISACLRHGVPAIPGIFTPSEALSAYEHGASFLKIFPAAVLGPSFLAALKTVLPQLPLIPVGGVDVDTVKIFLDSGAAALAVGSAIVNGRLAAEGAYKRIEENAATFRERIDSCLM